MYIEKIVDTVTGEESTKPLSDKEIKEIEKNIIEAQQIVEASEKAAIARAAVLEKLGLTLDEAKLLLG